MTTLWKVVAGLVLQNQQMRLELKRLRRVAKGGERECSVPPLPPRLVLKMKKKVRRDERLMKKRSQQVVRAPRR